MTVAVILGVDVVQQTTDRSRVRRSSGPLEETLSNSASYPQRNEKLVVVYTVGNYGFDRGAVTLHHGSNCPIAQVLDDHIKRCAITRSNLSQSVATSYRSLLVSIYSNKKLSYR